MTTRRCVLAALAALVASCATVPGSVEISKQQIESALARRFPYDSRAGQLLAVKVAAPSVELLPDVNRLRLASSFDVTERIARNTVHGSLTLSFGLRYEPSDMTLRLAGVQVDSVEVQQLPDTWRREVEAIAAYAAEHLLENMVLHRFTPEQVARAAGVQPGEIRVTSRGVRVELQPR
jgi:hypothetical protein